MKSALIFFVVLFTVHSIGCGAETKRLKASAAKAIITPPLGTYMVEPQAARATGVHDDLYLRLVIISDGTQSVVMASYDLVGLEPLLAEQIRNDVSEKTGIPEENIMLNCTHAHNVPMTVSLGGDMSRRNLEWEKKLKNITVETVQKALKAVKPASITVGSQEVQVAFNRRLMMFNRARMMPNPYGPVVKQTQAISINFGKDSSAVLFTYPAHPVAVHSGSAEFTADFPGFAIEAIEKEMGNKVIPIFYQGCAGDINVDPLQGGYEAAARVGQVLGDAVVQAVKKSDTLSNFYIKAQSEKFYLPYRPIEPEVADKVVLRVEEGLQALQASGADSINIMDTKDVLHWAKTLKKVAENPEAHPGLPFEIQVFAFGKDLAVIAFTHEMFVEYQMYVQENSPFKHTLVLAYTNGNASYIPTAEAFYLNGYEVHGAQHRYGTPYLTPESDALIKEKSQTLLNEIYQQMANKSLE